MPDTYVCEIRGWCPVEVDRLPLNKEEGPLIPGVENYTVFIKNSISFTRFGENYHRTNMPHGICIYKPDKPGMYLCSIIMYLDVLYRAHLLTSLTVDVYRDINGGFVFSCNFFTLKF